MPDSMMLSPREREIVILLGNGSDRTYRDVATMLGIRLSTVRSHVDRIMSRNPRHLISPVRFISHPVCSKFRAKK